MDFLQKYFNGVFELPLPRNAQKRTKKKSDGGWVCLGFSKCTGGSVEKKIAAPRDYILHGAGEQGREKQKQNKTHRRRFFAENKRTRGGRYCKTRDRTELREESIW
jgi:hypothetical protein